MNKPTNEQLELTREIIEWLVQYTERVEPYAVDLINSGNEFVQAMPMNQEEIAE